MALALASTVAVAPLVKAATTERIVLDHRTGLAIHGFDPVAYFTDAAATVGREELELSYGGAVWRFRNPGNRSAFAHDPQIYMPQFGGYDPVALAHGNAIAGHPYLWFVAEGRLYLFHNRPALETFAADPARAAAAAQATWPTVARSLVP